MPALLPTETMAAAASRECLWHAVEISVRQRQCVVAFTGWQHLPDVVLLAADHHLTDPARLDCLSLYTAFGVAPFRPADRRMMELAIYSPAAALQARREARMTRARTRTVDELLEEVDWEEGYRRQAERLTTPTLGANSFLSIDRVWQGAYVSHGTRPTLGSHCRRQRRRPSLLVPAFGVLDDSAAALLADVEILLLNIQDLRALNSLAMTRAILTKRGMARPTVIITQSPNELRDFLQGFSQYPPVLRESGPLPQLAECDVISVGTDRPQHERIFDASLRPLAELSDRVRELADLAKRAWWEARQVLSPDHPRPALERLRTSVDALSRIVPHEARLLRAAEHFISDPSRSSSEARLSESIRAVNSTIETDESVLVLARDSWSVNVLQRRLADHWECVPSDLAHLGVRFATAYPGSVRGHNPHTVIATGFFGPRSLDAMLAARPKRLRLLLDPIEAGWLISCAAQQHQLLARYGACVSLQPLEHIRRAASTVAIPDAALVTLDTTLGSGATYHIRSSDTGGAEASTTEEAEREVSIFLYDGTVLHAPAHRRFDVLTGSRTAIARVTAECLEPGHEIVVVAGDHQRTLSELLLEVLDQGPLKECATKRDLWLSLVHDAAARSNEDAILRRFRQEYPIDRGQLRRWILQAGEAFDEKSVPRSANLFVALARALGIDAPPAFLNQLYNATREWRIKHQLAGRRLVRAMCAATLGRLDALTAERISEEWGGLDVRDLLEGTSLSLVDHTSR